MAFYEGKYKSKKRERSHNLGPLFPFIVTNLTIGVCLDQWFRFTWKIKRHLNPKAKI